MVPFTTMCAACTSPSMRASADTTRVPGWSGSAATLPRTMPSTRRPPLKITLPSMRVVAPIRLSIRFCGLLLVLLNISLFLPYRIPLLSLQAYRVRRPRLPRAAFVDACLHALDFRFGAHSEGALYPAEVPEIQLEGRRSGIRLLGEAHHSTLPPLRQVHHQLEAAVEVAVATRAGSEN